MRQLTYILLLLFVVSTHSAYSQKVKSKTVGIQISNIPVEIIPDNSPPSITLLSPEIQEGEAFRTNMSEINLLGEVVDEGNIWFVSVNSDILMVNEIGIFSTKLKLELGENQIEVIAMDEERNQRKRFYTIEYQPLIPPLAEEIYRNSKFYGLIIGIDNYEDPALPDLENPISDAIELYDVLTDKYSFRQPDVTFLKDPTRNDLIFALDDLAQKVTPDDNVLIFYAGHGTWMEKASIGYWLPSDAYLTTTANWFRNSALVDYLKAIDSKHTLLITDACFAGSIFKTRSAYANKEKAYEILYELKSRKAMTSGTLTEVPDRSSFTKYLIRRLNENEETFLSSEQLFSSFRLAVINNSDAIPQFGEIGKVGDEGGDFIFLKRLH